VVANLGHKSLAATTRNRAPKSKDSWSRVEKASHTAERHETSLPAIKVSHPGSSEKLASSALLSIFPLSEHGTTELAAGTSWTTEITRFLTEVDLVIGVLTRDRRSDWTLFELGTSLGEQASNLAFHTAEGPGVRSSGFRGSDDSHEYRRAPRLLVSSHRPSPLDQVPRMPRHQSSLLSMQ
jgi:hypothetical protein